MQNTLTKPINNARSSEQSNAENELDAIYKLQHRGLWAQFYSFCSDAERATEALQEAFLRLQRQDLATIKSPRAWLLQVGRNWLRDVARKKKRSDATEAQLNDVPDIAESASVTFARAETRQTVRAALAKLRESDRIVLSLRYGMNWSAARIATTLESSPPAIDMRLCRARGRLREILAEMDPELAGAEV
jgi:RNA polymerase sigma-70 factor (ECF subfamily)